MHTYFAGARGASTFTDVLGPAPPPIDSTDEHSKQSDAAAVATVSHDILRVLSGSKRSTHQCSAKGRFRPPQHMRDASFSQVAGLLLQLTSRRAL